jgi:hypothetical protein
VLAEIFLLKLEALARTANGPRLPMSDTRFVPIKTQPTVTSKQG